MPVSTDELYLFGITREGVSFRLDPADWPGAMRDRFAAFLGPAPRLVRGGTGFHYASVEEIAAESLWSAGSVVLIGDAAHAMTPFMGQGASMALEDAVVLADSLAEGLSVRPASPDDVATLLSRFQERRRPRVSFVQERPLAAGRAWGSDADQFSVERLRSTMQQRVDELYGVLANPV